MLDVSKYSVLSAVEIPLKVDFGYCSGTCERKVSLREKLFYEASNDEKVMEVKGSLDMERGCCVPESYYKTSVFIGGISGDDFIENLVVKSCHCIK